MIKKLAVAFLCMGSPAFAANTIHCNLESATTKTQVVLPVNLPENSIESELDGIYLYIESFYESESGEVDAVVYAGADKESSHRVELPVFKLADKEEQKLVETLVPETSFSLTCTAYNR